ncbi:T9SS type A sorting domain-containing protein [Fluviicola chungangensis]|uniref:T9SS type A sorting domain-containing protein n=1 Tax=Fluviicola chungangensis TaxID=2597671 RepID=A0A556N6D6_9FLAO|nr:T9SS type A sorting domain-containing protein [Fluviicola chungangensis]TSJ47754.1 T9SS type A sorting domain-containing protein [Fluviicola chungangensis]
MKKKSVLILAAAFSLGLNTAKAQTPFNPTIYSGWLTTPDNYFANLPAGSGVTFDQPRRGSGNQFSTSADGINSGQWQNTSAADAIAANRYFAFSVIANSTTSFQVDSLLLILGRTGAGPDSCILQYKSPATGYAFVPVAPNTYTILNPTTAPTTSITITPASPLMVSASDSIVFRLVAWHASSSLGKMRIVNGTEIYGSSLTAPINTIEAPVVQTTNALCVSAIKGDSVEITFNAVGTFNPGNTYSLELSDAAGSFAAPVTIGSLNSQLNGGTIYGFIPAGTLNASYRLRVRSSNPPVNGLDTTNLLVNPGISLSASILQPDCPDSLGAIDLTISGGSGTLQYNWSGGQTTEDVTDLSAGNVDVLVTDAIGCSADSSFQVVSVPAFSIVESITNALCHSGNEGEITVAVTGATAPYTISWTGNGINQTGLTASGLTAGNYNLFISDANNCHYSDTYTVSEPSSIMVAAVITNATCASCNGTISLTVSGGNAPYAYEWANNTTLSQITAVPGTYCVDISDANSCIIDSCFVISSAAGIETSDQLMLSVFPNPASEFVQIQFSDGLNGVSKNVSIADLSGKIIYSADLPGEMNLLEIPVNHWSNGTYTYRINAENNLPVSGRMVISH